MRVSLWAFIEFLFRLSVVVFSFFWALGQFARSFGLEAVVILRRPYNGPRSEMFHGGNLVSRAAASIEREASKLTARVGSRKSESLRRGVSGYSDVLRASWPWGSKTWPGRTLVLKVDDQSVAFYLTEKESSALFISTHPQSSWADILLPLERLIVDLAATEIILLCPHHPHTSLPIQSIRGVLHNHPDDLLYLPPVSKTVRFDRWVVDGEGRLAQSEKPEAWWDVLVDRQSNVAPGFPVAMTRDTLRFASKYLTGTAPDSTSVVKLGLWLQQSGRAVWEMRESGTIRVEADPRNCRLEYPELAASLAQSLRSEFIDLLTPIRTHEKIVAPAKRLSAIEIKDRNCQLGDEKNGALKVLYLSPVATHPTNHGNRKTMVSFGEILKDAGVEILFASPMDWATSPQDVRLMEEFWGAVEVLPPSGQPLGAYGAEFDSWITPEICSRVRYLCLEKDIDVVLCSYVWFSAVLDFVPDYITKILDTHDKFSDRFALLESRGLPKEYFSCTPEEEGRYLSRADVILARRSEEAEYFQSLVPGTRVEVVTHIESPRHVAVPPDGTRLSFGLIASRNQINAAILKEFLESIIARAGQLDFDLVIAGWVTDLVPSTLLKQASKALEGEVRTLGFVENLEQFYSQVHCIVSPVSIGTGVNVKTLEALSFGMPIISTQHGSKGTYSTLPEHNFVGVEALVSGMTKVSFPELQRLRKESKKIAEKLWSENSRRLLGVVARKASQEDCGK